MAGTAPIVSRGFGSWGDVNLVVTAGYMSGSAPAPPSGFTNIFITGRGPRRKASIVGTSFVWRSLWSIVLWISR